MSDAPAPTAVGIPFVLRRRTPLPAPSEPGTGDRYDRELQIWLAPSGRPLVLEQLTAQEGAAGGMDGPARASAVGETLLTKTSEGTDRSERVTASTFGETTTTRTGEATDRAERADTEGVREDSAVHAVTRRGMSGRPLHASNFGETLQTATGEGTDRAERVACAG